MSFPEYAGQVYKNKQKIVVSGSHGKSTITAMIMHVFNAVNLDADYLLGGILKGFDRMVSLGDAPIVVIEGDEYLSSRIDPTPKMMHYHGDIIILTGIEWDHKNVFPTLDIYISQFENIIEQGLKEMADIIWYKGDVVLQKLMAGYPEKKNHPYVGLQSRDGNLIYQKKKYPIQVFGDHNLANINAALLACERVGINGNIFCNAMASFSGVGRRLERIWDRPIVYLDYAHAPSKVRATVEAVRKNHCGLRFLAVYELHTYSSLSKDFLPHYDGTMKEADAAIICYDPHTIKMKRLEDIEPQYVALSFNKKDLLVINNRGKLERALSEMKDDYDVLLFMSSGTFWGLDFISILK